MAKFRIFRKKAPEVKIERAEEVISRTIIAEAVEGREFLEKTPPELGRARAIFYRIKALDVQNLARGLQVIVRRRKGRKKIPAIFRDEVEIDEKVRKAVDDALADLNKYDSLGKKKYLKKAINILNDIAALEVREVAEERATERIA
ncbi:hypothetical protein KY360_03525 [Candidatus Woesearchaeota archaeon]|nr:hypothetical protein [Candidatus Woesearchaeota archaeon]